MGATRCTLHRMSRVYVSVSDEEREKLRELAKRWSRSESNTALMLVRRGLAQLADEVLAGEVTSSDLQNLAVR